MKTLTKNNIKLLLLTMTAVLMASVNAHSQCNRTFYLCNYSECSEMGGACVQHPNTTSTARVTGVAACRSPHHREEVATSCGGHYVWNYEQSKCSIFRPDVPCGDGNIAVPCTTTIAKNMQPDARSKVLLTQLITFE